jgi:ankyrin repeat protein
MLKVTNKVASPTPQAMPRKRPAEAETEFEIPLDLPRLLPITLEEQEEPLVSALVSEYQNTPNFNPELRVPPSGRSSLMQAAFTGDYITFVALIRMGAQVNRASRPQAVEVEKIHDSHWTPLLMASYKGRLKMVELLLKFGVNVNHESHFGHTALTLGNEYTGNKEIEALLLEHGADPDLHRKTRDQILREHGRLPVNHPDAKKEEPTPQAHASAIDIHNPQLLSALLGKTIEASAPQPQPPVKNHRTEQEEKEAIAAAVKTHQKNRYFNVDGRVSGRTILMQALFDRNIIEFFALLTLGADINRESRGCDTTCEYWTPLMVASHRGSLRMVEELVKRGAKVNCQSLHGQTALMLAASCNHPEIVEFLLKNGAIDPANSPAKPGGLFFSPQINPQLLQRLQSHAEAALILCSLHKAEVGPQVDSPDKSTLESKDQAQEPVVPSKLVM